MQGNAKLRNTIALLKRFVLPALVPTVLVAGIAFAVCDAIHARRSFKTYVDEALDEILPSWNVAALERRAIPNSSERNADVMKRFQACREQLGRFVSYQGVGKTAVEEFERQGRFTAKAEYQRGVAHIHMVLKQPVGFGNWRIASMTVETDPKLHDDAHDLALVISISSTTNGTQYVINNRQVTVRQIDAMLQRISTLGQVVIGLDYDNISHEVQRLRHSIRRYGLTDVLCRGNDFRNLDEQREADAPGDRESIPVAIEIVPR